MRLEDLGYNDFYESCGEVDGFSIARVIVEHKEAYRVKNTAGEYMAKITGKHMFNASSREDYPAVGDWVTITDLGEDRAVIHSVLPRQTMIKRKQSGKNEIQVIAANIDVAFVIESVDRDYNLNRLDRYFVIARDGGIQPALILNKIDLISKDQLQSRIEQIQSRFGDMNFILTSTLCHQGIDTLKAYIQKGRTYCFLGSSGVGKSSLINTLIGDDIIKTGPISKRSDRGKHTTTTRQMHFLENGGIVIDNPGMREIGMTESDEGIDTLFDQITDLSQMCKYVDCTHAHEPGCAVLSAMKEGRVGEDIYRNYLKLKKETEFYKLTEYEKRQKDSKTGKFFKKSKNQLKRYKHKNY